MNKICRPFKSASLLSITQGFSKGTHEAVDITAPYGTWLVAPENIKITRIKNGIDWHNPKETEQGYGIAFHSVEFPTRTYCFWHTLPVFPVEEGDIVLQGEPICQMGNSGWVSSGGQYVPLEVRTKPPYYGTHLHYSLGIDGKNASCLDWIDWNIPIKGDTFSAIKNVIQKIILLIKGR